MKIQRHNNDVLLSTFETIHKIGISYFIVKLSLSNHPDNFILINKKILLKISKNIIVL